MADTRYREYWEEMPCYLSVHDREFRIIDGNQRFRADFGDRIGDFCYCVYKGREEICPDCPVEATFADGESHSSEQTLINKRGRKVPVMVNTTPVRDEGGKVVAVMEMHTDLTEVKRLEGLLEHSQQRLAQLFVERYRAPSLGDALPAARSEAEYAAALSDHKAHQLLAMEREEGPDGLVERVRLVRPERASSHAKIWEIVADEAHEAGGASEPGDGENEPD